MSRLDDVKEVLFNQIEEKGPKYKRLNGYDHLFGVSALCGKMAKERGLDVELACIIGLLHDCSTYITGNTYRHALWSSEYASKFLRSLPFSDEEIVIITTAIKNHSSKDRIDDEYSELIKDADVLHQYLQQPDTLFSKDYQDRLDKML